MNNHIVFDNPTFATIDYVDRKGFAFARNGEPQSIFCHVNDGVFRIRVQGDLLVPDYTCRTRFIPPVGDQLVIVRETPDINHKHLKARVWAPASAYQKAISFRNKRSVVYIATAINHRDNGRIISNKRSDMLFRGNLVTLEHLPFDERAKLVKHYSTTITVGEKRRTFTYDVIWKKVCDGKETICENPLAQILTP